MFIFTPRERGKEEWSSVSRSAKPGSDILISNLSPATWYQIKVIQSSKNLVDASEVQVTGEAQGPSSEPSHTSLEFEIATLAADGSGFSGDNVPCSSSRMCHREEREVLRKQPEQQARDQPGDVRPPLLQEALLHPLDVQPNLPGRQMLDEDLWQWKDQVHNRLHFGSEGLWRKRLLSSRSHQHSSSCYGKLQSSLDLTRHRLLPLPRVELHLV